MLVSFLCFVLMSLRLVGVTLQSAPIATLKAPPSGMDTIKMSRPQAAVSTTVFACSTAFESFRQPQKTHHIHHILLPLQLIRPMFRDLMVHHSLLSTGLPNHSLVREPVLNPVHHNTSDQCTS